MTAHHRMLSRSGYSGADTPGTPAADKAARFRALALPHLDELYTLARYLLRDATDADDAVQECYLRALRHFETFRGGPIKPWLLAILRNVCRAEYARRGKVSVLHTDDLQEAADTASQGLWSEAASSPEAASLARLDAESAQQLIADLPEQFREVLVLREVNDLSYREIADVIGIPLGTVMSRLARGRTLLRQAWAAEEI